MNAKDWQSLMGGIELSQWMRSMTYLQKTSLRLSEAYLDYVQKDLPKVASMLLCPSASMSD